jgi:hypothetical protein
MNVVTVEETVEDMVDDSVDVAEDVPVVVKDVVPDVLAVELRELVTLDETVVVIDSEAELVAEVDRVDDTVEVWVDDGDVREQSRNTPTCQSVIAVEMNDAPSPQFEVSLTRNVPSPMSLQSGVFPE